MTGSERRVSPPEQILTADNLEGLSPQIAAKILDWFVLSEELTEAEAASIARQLDRNTSVESAS